MIRNFERYARILRVLGNFRHGYVIFNVESNVEKIEIIRRLNYEEYSNLTNLEQIRNAIETSSAPIIILNLSESVLSEHFELLCYCNELICKLDFLNAHRDKLNGFKIAVNNDDQIVLISRVISYQTAIAFEPSKNLTINDFKAEPYHVLIYDARKEFVMFVIWDTREIVSIQENLTREQIETIMNLKHANDSSKLLYCWKQPYETCSDEVKHIIEQDYLLEIIEQY